MLRYYQVDLRDLWDEHTRLTPRYVLWLAGHLPSDSALSGSMRGGEQLRDWNSALHIQAAVANMLFVANRQRAGKATKQMPIKPPSPTVKRARTGRRVANIAQIAARMRAKNAAEAAKSQSGR